MCGIAGIWNKKGTNESGTALNLMANSLKKRGPDDEGYVLISDSDTRTYFGDDSQMFNHSKANYFGAKHIKEADNINCKIGFAFRRLSILDLTEMGHQPMCDETGQFWLVFNGEIYNFKELRDQLISLGHQFRSNADSEVVLKSYKQWGVSCLNKFNGMFAFGLYDGTKNELFFARDRIGIKPLYYFENEDRFIFGSTIKSIKASGFYTPEIDNIGLQQNFVYSISQRPQTAFKNIKALAPGNYLKIELNTGSRIQQQYWNIPVGVQDYSMTEKKAVTLLEEALLKAVEYRLISDVEVGTFMSGGIDSTLISAMAGKFNHGIKAFTLGVDERYPEFNEIEEAKANAKLNELDHHISIVDPTSILNHLDEIVEAYEEPYHHLPVNYLVSKMVHEAGLKVVLSGLGGDELFAGYDAHAKLARWQKIQMLPKMGKLLPSGIHQKADKLKKFTNIKNIGEYYAHYYSSFEQNEIEALFEDVEQNLSSTIQQVYNPQKIDFADDIEALNYYNVKSYIGSHHVRTIDQFTMNFSLEGRFPFLDHELVELAFKIPTRLKMHNGIQKFVLRKVAKKYIAPECLKMNKKGFSLPLDGFLKNELKSFTFEHILKLKKRNILKQEGIDGVMKKGDASQIWQLVMTELWCQKYFDS